MKKRKVISNVPYRLPVYQSAVAYLLLDHFHAAGWIWGAVGFFFVILWIISFLLVASQQIIDVFPIEKDEPEKISKQERQQINLADWNKRMDEIKKKTN